MTMTMTIDQRPPEHEETEAYVLGSLSPDVVEAFEARLSESAALRQQVQAARAVTWMLAESPPQVTPSATLRARVLAAAVAMEPLPLAHHEDAREPEPLRLADRRGERRRARRWTIWFGAAAAVLVVGLVGWNMILSRQIVRLQAEVERDRAAFETLAAADRFWTMRGVPDQAPNAVSTLALNLRHSQSALVVSDFEPLPASQVYQVWVVHQGRPIAIGTFAPSNEQRQLTLVVPSDLSGVTQAMITIEPTGGSSTPTGVTVMTGDL